MNRARWMQRVLSPWTQRWLAATSRRSDRLTGQLPFASLTGADTQRTLARVQLQYESHTNLALPTVGGSLPLAGAVEKPISAVEASAAPAAARRAQGPYSRPFNSLDDFIHAIEAAKERNYAPPPPAETQPPPAPQHAVGPYSRPFQSMEDFVQAVNAARERNYAPPPDEQLPPPAPKREAGPYTRAFSSFDDFVKAVEATRGQWGSVAAEEPAAPSEPQPSVPPARVRPISQIEELPVRGETRPATSPIVRPTPPPEVSQPAAPTQPASAQPQPAIAPRSTAPATAPAAASTSPTVQRSPLPSSLESNQSEAKAEPTFQRSVTPPLQRAEPPTRSEPAAPPVGDVAESAATLQADTPPSTQSLDMPLVQRHSAEDQTSATPPAAVAEPIETRSPIGQGQAAEDLPQVDVSRTPVVQRQAAMTPQPPVSENTLERAVEPSVPLESAAPSLPRPDLPSVQRQPEIEEEPIEQQPVANPVQPTATAAPVAPLDMPLVQRQPIDEVIDPKAPTDQTAPVMQRQIAATASATPELPATSEPTQPAMAQHQAAQPVTLSTAPQQRESISTQIDRALPPSSEQTPAQSIDLPVMQRRPSAPEPAHPIESAAEAPGELPKISSASDAPLQPEKPAEMRSASLEMPLVQRQLVEPSEAAEETNQLVTAQRQVEVNAPPPTAPPAVPPTQRGTPVVPAQPERTAEVQAARLEMPLAQRHTPETAESSEEIDQTTDTVQRRAEASLPAPAEAVAQPVEKKIVAPLTESTAPAPRVEMPLVQHQPAAIKSETADLSAEATTAEETTSPDVLQRAALPVERPPESLRPQESAALRPATPTPAEPAPRGAHTLPEALAETQPAAPSIQRQVAEPVAAAQPVKPSSGESAVAPPMAGDAHTPLDMPLVQRQVESQTAEPAVTQRSAVSGETPVVQSAPDLSERILSRVAPPERRAPAKPIDLPLHRAPVQPESQPVAPAVSRPVAHESGFAVVAPPALAPGSAPSIQRMPEPVIQRTPIESADSSAEAGFIQRTETVPELAAQPPEAAPVDLDQLARQVYPLIKRLIAIERERRAFR
jgi:hypothetical protein